MPPAWTPTSTAQELTSHYAPQILNRVILTTGVSPSSLGAAFVTTLARASPKTLILAGRDEAKLSAAAAAVRAANPAVQTRTLLLDLADLGDVRRAAEEVNAYPPEVGVVDVLVNNAAVMAGPYGRTADGLEMQFGTAHVGHFLFTNLLLSGGGMRGDARVVNIASDGHRLSGIRWGDYGFSDGATYDPWIAYGQAKTANMLFTVALASRYGSRGLTAFSVHPGVINTNLGQHCNEDDFKALGEMDAKQGNYEATSGLVFKDLQQGTATHVFAAFDPDLQSHNGAYCLDSRLAAPREIRNNATDSKDAERLWELSETIVGEKF